MTDLLAREGRLRSAEAVVTGLQERGFDLRRLVFIGYLVGLGDNRAGAYLLCRAAAADGWQPSLYADETGWMVRLGLLVRPRSRELSESAARADELAASFHAVVRGLCVENLSTANAWTRLADVLRREPPMPPEDGARGVDLSQSA